MEEIGAQREPYGLKQVAVGDYPTLEPNRAITVAFVLILSHIPSGTGSPSEAIKLLVKRGNRRGEGFWKAA